MKRQKFDVNDRAALMEAAACPPRDYLVIVGGCRVKEKLSIIEGFFGKAGTVLVAGAVSYTFLAALGKNVGTSKIKTDCLERCKKMLGESEERGVKIMLPIDHISAGQIEPEITIKMIKQGENIPENMMGLDIGFDTVKSFAREIAAARFVVWYAPVGVSHIENFSAGTHELAKAVTSSQAVSVVLGKELTATLAEKNLLEGFSYVVEESSAVLDLLTAEDKSQE